MYSNHTEVRQQYYFQFLFNYRTFLESLPAGWQVEQFHTGPVFVIWHVPGLLWNWPNGQELATAGQSSLFFFHDLTYSFDTFWHHNYKIFSFLSLLAYMAH